MRKDPQLRGKSISHKSKWGFNFLPTGPPI